MKILFLEQSSETGGGQRNLLDLLPAVMERGWEAVVAAPGEGPLFDKARELGASTVKAALGHYSNGRKSNSEGMRMAFDSMRLAMWIAQHDCELISVGGGRALPAASLGARRRPVIFQAQHFLDDARALRLARWAIRRADVTVVANSKHVAQLYENCTRVRVVYNGVPEIPFSERALLQPLRIGIIGRIAPMKGQTDFLQMAAALTPKLPGTRFLICGAPMFCPASYVDEVNRMAAGLPIDFLGWRENVSAVLKELDLLVVPSTVAEATTRVILEAFSAGVPVVAYAIAGIPEVVEDGRNGFLVSECEPLALAQKVLRVLQTDLREIVQTARADWQRNYTVARYQKEMIDMMAECASTDGLRYRSASNN